MCVYFFREARGCKNPTWSVLPRCAWHLRGPFVRVAWGLVANGRRLAVTSVAGVQRVAVTNGLANLFVTFPATAANGRLARWAVAGLRFGASSGLHLPPARVKNSGAEAA